ncbi:MAG: DoxX family protein [Saprospiraceae bacterium]
MAAINRIFNPLSRNWAIDLGLFLLRAGTGVLLVPHGIMKVNSFSEKADGFYNFMHLGGRVSMGLTIFAEVVCSILLVLGLFTRLTLIPLIITMIVAVFVINPNATLGDRESGLLYLVPYVVLFFTGPGRISMDQMLFGRKQTVAKV